MKVKLAAIIVCTAALLLSIAAVIPFVKAQRARNEVRTLALASFHADITELRQAAQARNWEYTQNAVKSLRQTVDVGEDFLPLDCQQCFLNILAAYNDIPKAVWRGAEDAEMDWRVIILQCDTILGQ